MLKWNVPTLPPQRNPLAASYLQLPKPVKTFLPSLQRHSPTALTSAASPGGSLGAAAEREMPDITGLLWCTAADGWKAAYTRNTEGKVPKCLLIPAWSRFAKDSSRALPYKVNASGKVNRGMGVNANQNVNQVMGVIVCLSYFLSLFPAEGGLAEAFCTFAGDLCSSRGEKMEFKTGLNGLMPWENLNVAGGRADKW